MVMDKIWTKYFILLFVLCMETNKIWITPISDLLNLNNEGIIVSIIRVDGLDSIIVERWKSFFM